MIERAAVLPANHVYRVTIITPGKRPADLERETFTLIAPDSDLADAWRCAIARFGPERVLAVRPKAASYRQKTFTNAPSSPVEAISGAGGYLPTDPGPQAAQKAI